MTDEASRRPALWLVVAVLLAAGACLGIVGTLLLLPDRQAEAGPGAVDIGFAQDMGVHHDQAIVMAQMALSNAGDPRLQAYARKILVAQAEERGALRGWMILWGSPQSPSGRPMGWMKGGTDHHHHAEGPAMMPGMATPKQLSRLAQLKGSAFDTEFITLMSRHHVGGIHMAQYAQKHATLPEVRSMAALMAKEQTEEIAAFAAIHKELQG